MIAHSEDCQSKLDPFSQNRIAKQVSSDIKAIKISKLIDFHREIEQRRSSDIFGQFPGAQSATKAETQFKHGEIVDHEMKMSEDQDISNSSPKFTASKFCLNKIEGDRFIPMRTIIEEEEIQQNLDTKIEIEQCPPLNLNEDSHLESASSNN